MNFNQLVEASVRVPVIVGGDAEVSSITIDSRRAAPGALFVCMPGMNRDSQSFLRDAVANGAVAAMVYESNSFVEARQLGLAALRVDDEGVSYPDSVWRLCDRFFDHPTRGMRVLGVTGTNGKTTTASIARDMMRALGLRAAYLGTLGFEVQDERRELANTTPFAVDLYNMLAEARDAGVEALAMEVSSHALDQRRVDGVEFDAAVFLNLTQDHLDYHGSMETYAAAKRRLFTELPHQTAKPFTAAYNQDNEVGRSWASEIEGPKIGFSSKAPSDVWASDVEVGLDRIGLKIHFGLDLAERIEVRLGGHYNVENLVAAIAGMRALGFEPVDILSAASAIRPVRGRFEPVPNDFGIHVLVDYAHTPDALHKLLVTARALTPGRLITVFGCGGDRDRTKRPLMARFASQLSDLTLATSDNPRTEDPQAILNEVLTGILPGKESLAIVDRREAVAVAVRRARPGDTVVIAGKGHENYQIIGREKFHMDDRELAHDALALLGRLR